MKKIFTLIAIVTLTIGYFGFKAPASAYSISKDQRCQVPNYNTGRPLLDGDYLEQEFIPTLSRVDYVEAAINGGVAGGAVTTMQVLTSSGTSLGSKTITTTPGDGTRRWDFYPDITVTPGQTYKIKMTKTGAQPIWYYATGVCYGGLAYINGVTQWNLDFDFQTWGYNPDPVAPTQAPAASPSGNTGSSRGTTSTTATATATVDTSIKAPVLTSITKNGQKKDAPFKEEVTVSKNDKLTLFGTSAAGLKVVVFLGDKSYDATMATDGGWSVVVPLTGLSDGSYKILAQAQKDTKGSEKAQVLGLKVQTPAVTTVTTKKTAWPTYYYYLAGLTVALLAALIALALVYELRQKKNKKTKEPEKN